MTDYGALPSNYSNATFAINKDGEGMIQKEWIGKKYDTVLKDMIKKSIEMGFVEQDLFVLLVHSNTEIDFVSFENGIRPQIEKDYPGIQFETSSEISC